MDHLFDDARDERLIEDYLFSGYKANERQARDTDRQFARPIEDEDLFAIEPQTEEKAESNEADLSLGSSLDENRYDVENCDLDLDLEKPLPDVATHDEVSNFTSRLSEWDREPELEVVKSVAPKTKQYESARADIDEIFADDYSESSYPEKGSVKTADGAKSALQMRKALFLAKLKSQARQMAKKPKHLTEHLDPGNTMEFVIQQDRLVSDGHSKFIFNKMFNKSKKARQDSNGTPERAAKCWSDYKDSLRKRICNQKRKIWDSFNKTTVDIDDEEDFFEERREGSPEECEKSDEEANEGSTTGSDNADNVSQVSEDSQLSVNFEDLEQEDMIADEDSRPPETSDHEDDEEISL